MLFGRELGGHRRQLHAVRVRASTRRVVSQVPLNPIRASRSRRSTRWRRRCLLRTAPRSRGARPPKASTRGRRGCSTRGRRQPRPSATCQPFGRCCTGLIGLGPRSVTKSAWRCLHPAPAGALRPLPRVQAGRCASHIHGGFPDSKPLSARLRVHGLSPWMRAPSVLAVTGGAVGPISSGLPPGTSGASAAA